MGGQPDSRALTTKSATKAVDEENVSISSLEKEDIDLCSLSTEPISAHSQDFVLVPPSTTTALTTAVGSQTSSDNDTEDEETQKLLREIAGLAMSSQSGRLVPPTKGTMKKAAKVLGMDSDGNEIKSPTAKKPELVLGQKRDTNNESDEDSPFSAKNMAARRQKILDNLAKKGITKPGDEPIGQDAGTNADDTVRERRGKSLPLLLKSALPPVNTDTITLRKVEPKPSKASLKDAKTPRTGRSDSLSKDGKAGAYSSKSYPLTIRADYAEMLRRAPPDPEQHPVLQPNPFEAVSNAPLLETDTKIEELRRMALEMKKLKEENPDAPRINLLKYAREIGAMPPPAKFADLPDLTEEEAFRIPTFDEDEILAKYKGPATPQTGVGTPSRSFFNHADPAKTPASAGRKTSLFRNRSSLDRAEATATSQATYPGFEYNANVDRPDLEQYLRRTTNSHAAIHDPALDHQPPHPETGRVWNSRNLRCTTCRVNPCEICGRVCCHFRASVLALELHKMSPKIRYEAHQKIEEILRVYPITGEPSTFLKCRTRNGHGCDRVVCPECCGACPNPCCRNVLCRFCKKHPWEECDWHMTTEEMAERDAKSGLAITKD